jgi:hypothetical protein
MTDELFLARKWTLRAHGRQVVFVKRSNEKASHVLMKAFLWALYLRDYPNLVVELPVGDRYRPDVVGLDNMQRPTFWGESGEVSAAKIESLARRYRDTHFAIAKWDAKLEPHAALVERILGRFRRSAPFDVLVFPSNSADRFIENGEIHVSHADLEWVRIDGR